MGYRSDSIAISRDTGPLSCCLQKCLQYPGKWCPHTVCRDSKSLFDSKLTTQSTFYYGVVFLVRRGCLGEFQISRPFFCSETSFSRRVCKLWFPSRGSRLPDEEGLKSDKEEVKRGKEEVKLRLKRG